MDGNPGVDDSLNALATLTPREAEVLRVLTSGRTNVEVAAELGVTVHAVKFHLASIFRKLGVATRTEAVVTLMRYDQDHISGR